MEHELRSRRITLLPFLHYQPEVAMERLGSTAINSLLSSLSGLGYRTIGPRVRNGAIVLDDVAGADEFPKGWRDTQEPATYRLNREDTTLLFRHTAGPHSWKRFLFPPVLTLFTARRTPDGITITASSEDSGNQAKPFAFVGVRPCDLAALTIQDQVFSDSEHSDSVYRQRREGAFVVAVNCTKPGGTCFCASMGTGPRAVKGYDIVLTELEENGEPYYLAEAGTPRGHEVLEALPGRRPATQEEISRADKELGESSRSMGRAVDTDGVKEILAMASEYPRWDEVARRCLTCANCTLVCPTCFCSTLEDVTTLSGAEAMRHRKWDSCFTMEFSYIHGGSIRSTARSRYRHWLTHKFSGWIDQFGVSGCVGCGRCITWCPVGIDITEEVRAIRASHQTPVPTA